MKYRTVRVLVPLAVLLIAGIAFAMHLDVGNLSAIGWGDISLLCPVGALGTMLATKMAVPRALVSLAITVVAIVLIGKAFCAWVCPVPVVSKLRDAFSKKPLKPERSKGEHAPLSDEEKRLLKHSCSGSCAERHGTFDSRHLVLGGGLLSAAIFGFPVLCLVCPIGLSFATIFLLIRAFGFGDVSWALIIVPVFLILEVVVFRKWCHSFCPVSAIMGLVGKLNRTFQPSVDDATCIESAKEHECGRCAAVCPEGIDPRQPELGNGMNECTRCMECVEACPSGALTISLLPHGKAVAENEPVPSAGGDEASADKAGLL